MGYLYRHIRLDKNEPFYIGIGGFNKNETEGSYKRAYNKSRNSIWKKITSKTDYSVDIMLDGLTFEEACEKEIEFIALYKRIKDGGILANITLGGEGTLGHSTRKGHKTSDETKKKLSASHIGKVLTNEHKERIRNGNKGKKQSDECKIKCSISKIGHKNPMYGKKPPNSKKVIDTKSGIIYGSLTDAEKSLGMSKGYLSLVMSGRRKNNTNLVWLTQE